MVATRDAQVTQQDIPAATDPLFDEALLSTLRKLALVSRKTATTGLAGEHRSRRRGSSPEFADFKRYSQGDDYRSIDWNIYSRLDALFVRLSEITTELMVHMLLDSSGSMDWRQNEATRTKFGYARQLCGSFGYIGLWHFDRIAITPYSTEFGPTFGPAQGRAHLMPMINYLESLNAVGGTSWLSLLQRYVQARKRPGIMLIFSDLLSLEPGELQEGLRLLRSRGWQTTVVQVLDPWEIAPVALNGESALQLIDAEDNDTINLSLEDGVIDRYMTLFNSWLDAVEQTCQDEDTSYVRVQTDWPVESIVVRHLQQRGILV